MDKKVTIVDYGMGNLHSLQNAFNYLGYSSLIVSDPDLISKSNLIILPGVGSFGQAIKNIINLNLDSAIKESVNRGANLLGICLGMQLLASFGEEDGKYEGLNLIPGNVVKIDEKKIRLPHIGFNEVKIQNDSRGLYKNISNNSDFYFVHSYKFDCIKDESILTKTFYGNDFVSSVQSDNVFGVQFHPEKSQSNGLALLSNFLNIVSK